MEFSTHYVQHPVKQYVPDFQSSSTQFPPTMHIMLVGIEEVKYSCILLLLSSTGLVAGIIVHKLGARLSAGIGGILSFAGLLASSFAPSITAIYLTFGTIGRY